MKINAQGGCVERSSLSVKRWTLASAPRAFTLLEILIAIAAFAIVLAAINSVFYSALKLRNRAAASLEKSLPLTQALAILKRDLANLAAPGGTLSGELQTSLISGGSSSIGGVSDSSMPVSPDFHTLSGLVDADTPWPSMQRVSYRLADSTNLTAVGKDLVRAVTRNLLPTLVEAAPQEQLLLQGVEEVLFFYHNGTDWQESWDSTADETKKLPRAIKVQLLMATADRAAQQSPIELIVPIVVEASTNITDTASTGGDR
ncbi:MAG: Type secretion system protein [Verrucomicrobiota bacterium]